MAPRGNNLVIAAVLATFSYLPYEVVAKVTLIVCVLFFVLDPFPTSRLVSVVGVGVVLSLTKARNHFIEEDAVEVSEGTDSATTDEDAANKKD